MLNPPRARITPQHIDVTFPRRRTWSTWCPASTARPWARWRGATRRSCCACAWRSAGRSASWRRRRARHWRRALRSAPCAASTTAPRATRTTSPTRTAPWSASWCPSVRFVGSPSVHPWFTNIIFVLWNTSRLAPVLVYMRYTCKRLILHKSWNISAELDNYKPSHEPIAITTPCKLTMKTNYFFLYSLSYNISIVQVHTLLIIHRVLKVLKHINQHVTCYFDCMFKGS